MNDRQLVEINDPAILIRINKAYKSSLEDDALYDYTRGRWKLDSKIATNAKYAIAIYKSIVQVVYEIYDWYKAGTTNSSRNRTDKTELNYAESLIRRFEFTEKVATEKIRNKYLLKSVKHYFTKGSSNPVNYINI